MIKQTSLAYADVPRGGTIRETINWEGEVHGISTHTFYLFSFYGVGTTIDEILENIVTYNYITENIQGPGQSMQSIIDSPIAEDAPIGTDYSCATIIAEGFDGSTPIGIYDYQIDIGALTITQGLGANIVSVSFSQI